jgi:hypothetical protein
MKSPSTIDSLLWSTASSWGPPEVQPASWHLSHQARLFSQARPCVLRMHTDAGHEGTVAIEHAHIAARARRSQLMKPFADPASRV